MDENRILVGIPTKNRPEYLSILISSLLSQTEKNWDLLIVDSGDEDSKIEEHPLVYRMLVLVKEIQGKNVILIKKPNKTNSSVIANNTIILEAELRGYKILYKIDDDHWLPSDTLELMKKQFLHAKSKGIKALISGVTPWVVPAFPGAYGPESTVKYSEFNSDIEYNTFSDALKIGTDLFCRVEEKPKGVECIQSNLASDANFMMEPESSILQSELGPSCLHAFSVWFLQLHYFLEYDLYFCPWVEAWHLAAPNGGVREEEGNHVKDKQEDRARLEYLKMLCNKVL